MSAEPETLAAHRPAPRPLRALPAAVASKHLRVQLARLVNSREVMSLPRTILVPVDLSAYAEAALDYAVELAGKLDAKLYVLHVVSIPAVGVPELGVALAPSVIDSIVEDSEAALGKLADARRSKAQVAGVLLRKGDARELIINTADDVAADLIVMGTHGRRGVGRALLGSVAESVLRTASCPVLTIRGRKH